MAASSNHAALAGVMSSTTGGIHATSRGASRGALHAAGRRAVCGTSRTAGRSRGTIRADIRAVSISQRETLQ